MALTTTDIQKAYIAFFNRPADATGYNYWLTYTGDAEDLLTEFSKSAEYLSDYAGLTNTQVVDKVYQNLFGRAPEVGGLTFWVEQMDQGHVTIANAAHEIMNGAQNEDATTINNKVSAAQYFTDALDTPEKVAAYNDAGDNGVGNEAKLWLKTVDYSIASVDAAKLDLPALLQTLVDADVTSPQPGTDDVIWVGGSNPTLAGNDGNNTFIAQTGDLQDNAILDGKGGNDTLEATIRGNEAIAPSTSNIEKVIIRAQDSVDKADYDNNITDIATVDADRMQGVNQWESKNSRVDVKIEDVRIQNSQITKDITIAFRESDPGHVDYAVYFDQPSLRNQTSTSGVLTVALFDAQGAEQAGQPLRDNPFDTISFRVDGKLHTVIFDKVSGAGTFQELADAIQAGINAMPELTEYNINVDLTEGVTFWVPSDSAATRANAGYYITLKSTGHTIEAGTWNATGGLPGNNAILGRQDAFNPTTSSLVTSTVILDYVGRGSMGGDLVIGGMSTGYTSQSKGVQQFDISVERDSKLEVISSTNNTLQVVNLVNSGTYNYLGAYERGSNTGVRSSDLTVKGDSNVATVFGKPIGQLADPSASSADQNIDGAGGQQNNGYGFTDVRVLNGAAFRGNLDVNAFLSRAVVGKYMDLVDAAPNVAEADNDADNEIFTYNLGSGNDKLDLAISSANLEAAGTTSREDFVLNVSGGNGNDVITTAIVDDDPGTITLPNPGYMLHAENTGGSEHWYLNSKANANLAIDAGAGNDTISTTGSGDWTVRLGSGNDTYYADNTGNKAVWVFNTADQESAGGSVVERALDNLLTGDNASYIRINDGLGAANAGRSAGEMSGLFGLKLRVVYKDVSDTSNILPTATGQSTFITEAVSVPTTTPNSYIINDRQINQAIKAAINGDPVLSKLLVAKDGPSNTLVVTSLTDGEHLNVEDLGIEFAIPDTVAANDVAPWVAALNAALGSKAATTAWTGTVLQEGRIASLSSLLNVAEQTSFTGLAGLVSDYNNWGYGKLETSDPMTGYSSWYSANSGGALAGEASYIAAFAEDAAGAVIAGGSSEHTADNIVIVNGNGADHDVVVLGTGVFSNDTVQWAGGALGNGTVKVVNFNTASGADAFDDWLDFSSYGARWIGVETLDADGHVATWAASRDALGFNPAAAGVAGATETLATASTTGDTYVGDWKLTEGDKYITLTRAFEDDQTHTNHDGNTLYEIKLWTVNGNIADAYTVDTNDTGYRDTGDLIGYVDLGREIEGVVDLNSIIAHINIV